MPGLPFTLKDIEIFHAVCDYQSIAKAAEYLQVTQSAVSQQIQQLEKTVGNQLFNRKNRPLKLTHQGKLLQGITSDFLASAQRVSVLLAAKDGNKLPQLRIGIALTFSEVCLAEFLLQIKERVERVFCHSGTSLMLENSLKNHYVDVIVHNNPMASIPGLERHPIITESYIAVYPTKQLQDQKKVSLEWLIENMPFIQLPGDFYISQEISNYFRILDVEPANDLEINNLVNIGQLVNSGLGWTLMTPLLYMQLLQTNKNLSYLTLPKPGISPCLQVISRKQELGTLPQTLCEDAQNIINKHYYPKLEKKMPNLAKTIRLGA